MSFSRFQGAATYALGEYVGTINEMVHFVIYVADICVPASGHIKHRGLLIPSF